MNKNFKLGIFKFPGCYVICNTAVTKNHDYKTVAHVSFAGNIKYFVAEDYIPIEDRKKIENLAKNNREKFIDDLEEQIKSNDCYVKWKIYDRMLDCLPISEYADYIKYSDGKSIDEKMEYLKEKYIARN